MTHKGENQPTVRNEIFYLALFRCLKNRKPSEAFAAELGVSRDFFVARGRTIAFDDSMKEPSRDILTFTTRTTKQPARGGCSD